MQKFENVKQIPPPFQLKKVGEVSHMKFNNCDKIYELPSIARPTKPKDFEILIEHS